MSHTLQEPCNNCRKRCTERISEEQRELINEAFWSLPTEEERRFFVFHSCERISIKRRRSRLMLPIRKEKTIKYFFCNEDGQKVEVCMVFYLTTLGYNRKNDSIIRNTFLTPEGNLKPKPSMRGKASPANKIPRDVIKAHIERFLPREEDGTLTKCLPPEMKITAMFAHFKRIHPEHEKISYELYRRVIREEKISYSTASHEIGEPEGFYGHQEYQDDEDPVTCEPILYLV
nr:PREDICTED: uncharacterized protein LOC109043381 [Bemisia tabaci]